MRKQQLENLKMGNKVVNYNNKEITLFLLGLEEVEGKKRFTLKEIVTDRKPKVVEVSETTLLKNYKLVEETEEIAVTEEIPDMVGYLSQGMVEEQEEIVPDTTIGLDKIEDLETKAKAIEGAKTAIKKMKDKRKTKKVTDDTVITVTQMAAELGMTAPDARRILRKSKIEKPEGGWTVKKGSDKYLEIYRALQNTQEKRAERMGK